jgi:hypothetical protein
MFDCLQKKAKPLFPKQLALRRRCMTGYRHGRIQTIDPPTAVFFFSQMVDRQIGGNFVEEGTRLFNDVLIAYTEQPQIGILHKIGSCLA